MVDSSLPCICGVRVAVRPHAAAMRPRIVRYRMAPSCTLDRRERYMRMTIGAGFVVTGFVLHRDAFMAVSLVLTGSAMTAAASLGH